MISALKAELKKLLTVRSTYFITGLVVAIVIFVGFYVVGWRADAGSLHNPDFLKTVSSSAMNMVVFGAIVAILLMTHEYRYNTILHTLTSINNRSKVLASKFIVVSLYAIFLTVLIAVLSPVMAYLGTVAHGSALISQNLDYGDLVWRILFYGWGYGMAGLVLAVLVRNQIAAIVALFFIPGFVEGLIGNLLLKHNSVYMPFTALNQVLVGPKTGAMPTSSTMDPAEAAFVFCVYLAVGWLVAWWLFHRRDAN